METARAALDKGHSAQFVIRQIGTSEAALSRTIIASTRTIAKQVADAARNQQPDASAIQTAIDSVSAGGLDAANKYGKAKKPAAKPATGAGAQPTPEPSPSAPGPTAATLRRHVAAVLAIVDAIAAQQDKLANKIANDVAACHFDASKLKPSDVAVESDDDTGTVTLHPGGTRMLKITGGVPLYNFTWKAETPSGITAQISHDQLILTVASTAKPNSGVKLEVEGSGEGAKPAEITVKIVAAGQ